MLFAVLILADDFRWLTKLPRDLCASTEHREVAQAERLRRFEGGLKRLYACVLLPTRDVAS